MKDVRTALVETVSDSCDRADRPETSSRLEGATRTKPWVGLRSSKEGAKKENDSAYSGRTLREVWYCGKLPGCGAQASSSTRDRQPCGMEGDCRLHVE